MDTAGLEGDARILPHGDGAHAPGMQQFYGETDSCFFDLPYDPLSSTTATAGGAGTASMVPHTQPPPMFGLLPDHDANVDSPSADDVLSGDGSGYRSGSPSNPCSPFLHPNEDEAVQQQHPAFATRADPLLSSSLLPVGKPQMSGSGEYIFSPPSRPSSAASPSPTSSPNPHAHAHTMDAAAVAPSKKARRGSKPKAQATETQIGRKRKAPGGRPKKSVAVPDNLDSGSMDGDDHSSGHGASTPSLTATLQELNAFSHKSDLTEEEKKEVKRQQRLVRNRLSAQLSRERKKHYLGTLEKQLNDAKAETDKFRRQSANVQRENTELHAQIENLRAENKRLRDRLFHFDPNFCTETPTSVFLPMDGLGDTDGPAAKRAKLNHRRTLQARGPGLVMLALVCSFGVFYYMSGLDPSVQRAELSNNKLMPLDLRSPVFRGRALQGLADDAATSTDGSAQVERKQLSLPAPFSLLGYTGSQDTPTDEKKVDAMEVDAGATTPTATATPTTALSAKEMRSLSEQLQAKMHDFGLNVSADALGLDDLPPLDAATTSRGVTPIFVNDEGGDSKAVDLYNQNEDRIQQTLHDVLQMYKKMLQQSNASFSDQDLPTSIMFCPSAIHLVPQRQAVVAHISGQRSDTPVPKLDPRKMLLWVPSRSIAADWDLLNTVNPVNSTAGASTHAQPDDVMELAVSVASVRQVTG